MSTTAAAEDAISPSRFLYRNLPGLFVCCGGCAPPFEDDEMRGLRSEKGHNTTTVTSTMIIIIIAECGDFWWTSEKLAMITRS